MLNKFCQDKLRVINFRKPMTSPVSLKPDTTAVSPHLKFGSMSIRTFFWQITDIYHGSKQSHTNPPESLIGQIFFREFFYLSAFATTNFDRMLGNKHAKQIDWDQNQELLEAWASGNTGFPAIDATMRQLKQEGWIHHLGRHLVACFLTRGDLY